MAETTNDVAARDVNGARACASTNDTHHTSDVANLPRGRACLEHEALAAADASGGADDTTTDDVPEPLRRMIEQSVRDAVAATFHPDPTFGPALSRLVSVAASVQRRHGHMILEAMALGLEAGDQVTVLRDGAIRRIDVCPTARRVVRQLGGEACSRIDLGYDGAPIEGGDDHGPRVVEVDAIVLDKRDGAALAIESKRGGKVGAAVHRQLVESTSVVSTLLRAHLKRHGLSATGGDAIVLVQNTDRGLVLPDELGTTLGELDDRFDGQAERMVAAATALHARLVREAMGDLLKRAAIETCGPMGAHDLAERLAA